MQAQPQPRSAARSRQKARRSNVAALLPRLVLYYNRWTGFESHAIRGQFRPMTIAEVHAIAVGDEVWMSRDPIHPNGKVYGYARRRITGVAYLENDDIQLYFASGFTTVSPKRSTHPCAVIDDPRALARLIAWAQPLATQVSAY